MLSASWSHFLSFLFHSALFRARLSSVFEGLSDVGWLDSSSEYGISRMLSQIHVALNAELRTVISHRIDLLIHECRDYNWYWNIYSKICIDCGKPNYYYVAIAKTQLHMKLKAATLGQLLTKRDTKTRTRHKLNWEGRYPLEAMDQPKTIICLGCIRPLTSKKSIAKGGIGTVCERKLEKLKNERM